MSTAASPSTIAWWSLATMPTRPSSSRGTSSTCHSGRSRQSGVDSAASVSAWKLARLTGSSAGVSAPTWRAMSKLASSTQNGSLNGGGGNARRCRKRGARCRRVAMLSARDSGARPWAAPGGARTARSSRRACGRWASRLAGTSRRVDGAWFAFSPLPSGRFCSGPGRRKSSVIARSRTPPSLSNARNFRELRTLFHKNRHAAPAGIPAAGQLAGLGVARHGLHAAEVEVARRPALDLPAVALERLERGGVDPGLGVHLAGLEVHARPLAPPRAPACRRPPRSGGSGGSPSGCGSSRPSPAPPPACRRAAPPSAPSCSGSAARRVAVVAARVQVLLAQHVVEVHARAGHDTRPSRTRSSTSRWRRRRRRPSPRCAWCSRAGSAPRLPPSRAPPGEEALEVAVAVQARARTRRRVRGSSRPSPRPARAGRPGALEPLEQVERVRDQDAAVTAAGS